MRPRRDWVVVKAVRITMSMTGGEEFREVEYSVVPSAPVAEGGLNVVTGPMSKARAKREAERMQAASDVLET